MITNILNKKKSLKDSGLLQGFTDIHAHTLCGVDDGARNLNESQQMIARFAELGLKKCIITPHIMSSMYNNSAEHLENVFETKVKPLAQEYNIELSLGAEYMVDEKFISRFENKGKMLPISKKYILTELSAYQETMGWEDAYYELALSGYDSILAHPERYHYFSDKTLKDIKSRGTLLQLNFLSLQGFYGSRVMHRAEALLKLGIYDLVASDVHYISMIEDIANFKVDAKTLKELERLKENNENIINH